MSAVHVEDLRPADRERADAHTQELYAALDPVVQAVLTDKNADIDKLLDAANKQVQDIIDAG